MKPREVILAELVQRWFSMAEEDYAVAAWIAQNGSLSASAVGFHSQQAVEKAIKAYLVSQQLEFQKTHDIDRLIDLLIPEDPDLAETLREASFLTVYSVETRYPGDSPPMTQDDSAEALNVAKNVLDELRTKITPDLKSNDKES